MVNPWFVHLSAFRKSNPNLSMKQAMKAAKKSYKKVDGSKSKKVRKSRKSRKGTRKGMVRKTARRAYKK